MFKQYKFNKRILSLRKKISQRKGSIKNRNKLKLLNLNNKHLKIQSIKK